MSNALFFQGRAKNGIEAFPLIVGFENLYLDLDLNFNIL